ncbi:MAG: ATP-binding protein [Pirellulales bacterium]|nr:ATP-binding protein [Pirellulales bacterium]
MRANRDRAHPEIRVDPDTLDSSASLDTVLTAWHTATSRLEKTHETLRCEVERLTNELERKNRELERKQRLADLGQMAAHIAHEIHNNLMPVTLYTSLLRRRFSDDGDTLSIVTKVESGLEATRSTIQDLLHFTAEREPDMNSFTLRSVVDEVFDSLAPQLTAQEVVVDLDIDSDIHVAADRDMLRRAILNLTINALDAMPEGGVIVATGVQMSRTVELEIADSGPGMTTEARAHALEPFFTTKSTGTGLGLAIVDRIVRAHNGEVRLDSCPEGGLAITLCLPCTQANTLEAAA